MGRLLRSRMTATMPNHTTTIVVAAMLALPPMAVSAETLRCKNQTVNVGDLRASVLQRCGEPLRQHTFCKRVEAQSVQQTAAGVTVVTEPPCINVDEWTYNPGYGQFMTTLQIEGGVVKAIKYGDRVQ